MIEAAISKPTSERLGGNGREAVFTDRATFVRLLYGELASSSCISSEGVGTSQGRGGTPMKPMKVVPSSSGEMYLLLAIVSTVLMIEMAVFSLLRVG